MMLTIAGIAAVGAIFNALFPIINLGSSSIGGASGEVDERLITSIEIIQVVGELNSAGVFADTNANGLFEIFIWAKNVGSARILDLTATNLFIGSSGNFQRIPHEVELEAGVYPRWTHTVEDENAEWGPGVTMKLTVTYSSAQSEGHYDAKIVTPNGVTADYHFEM